MFPSSWVAIFGFFAFVAPGVLYDLLASRKRAERRETVLREIGRVALVSTCCTAASLLSTLAIGAATQRWLDAAFRLPRPRDLLLGDNRYLADHFIGVATTAVVFITISLLVAIVGYRLVHRNDDAAITHVSVWSAAFRADAPEGSFPFVRVRLLSGTSWAGRVIHYSPDLEVADRELVLGPPLATRAQNGTSQALPTGWGRIILRGDQIESISVQYQRRHAAGPSATSPPSS